MIDSLINVVTTLIFVIITGVALEMGGAIDLPSSSDWGNAIVEVITGNYEKPDSWA